MKNKKIPLFPLYTGLITAMVIALFLSGKVIDIPQGTREGGIIAGIGVVIILLVIFIILTLIIVIQKSKL